MANRKARTTPPTTRPSFSRSVSQLFSPGPRPPAIEKRQNDPRTGIVDLTIRFSALTPLTELKDKVGKIVSAVRDECLTERDDLRQKAERRAVVEAWSVGGDRKRQRTRAYIAKQTRIPEYRVKLILRDWNAFRKAWESPRGKRERRRKSSLRLPWMESAEAYFVDVGPRFVPIQGHTREQHRRLSAIVSRMF